MLPHPNTVYKDLKESYYTMTWRKQDFSRTLVESSSDGHHDSRRALKGTRRFLSSLLWIPPDDVLGWLPIAAVKGIRLVREHHITPHIRH